MSRWSDFTDVIRHKRAFLQVRANNPYLRSNIGLVRALMHDAGKAVNILLLGDNLATRIHRVMAGHHRGVEMDFRQKVEAFCDWECARLTKPEKPLDGIQTWRKYYADVDMGVIADNFNHTERN